MDYATLQRIIQGKRRPSGNAEEQQAAVARRQGAVAAYPRVGDPGKRRSSPPKSDCQLSRSRGDVTWRRELARR